MKAHTESRLCWLIASTFAALLAGCTAGPSAARQAAGNGWQHVQNGGMFEVSDRFGEGAVSYTAHWDSLELDKDGSGRATTISGTAYLRDVDCEPDERPVTFLFNGGPGASSSPLHFALGPKARGDEYFPDNPYTILRVSDLVFIDPVETGFSRAASEDGTSPYLSIDGDANAVKTYIDAWLKSHGREGAPVFVVGQSYGGFRLGNLVSELGDLRVHGLVMVSPALDMGAGGDLSHVFAMPTMAATAWRFGKSSIEAPSEEAAWEIAREFAESDYLVALQKGDRIEQGALEAIASRMAAMTGLPQDMIEDARLRIGIQPFLETLLADENKLVSRLNTAVTQEKRPPANPDRPDGANDPSLGLGKSNKIISEDIGNYLKDLTGLQRDDGYRSLNLDANFAWDWRRESRAPNFSYSVMPAFSRYLGGHEKTVMLVFGGIRDLAVPALETEYHLTHAGLPEERVTFVKMASGHSPFNEEDLQAPFAETIHEFILNSLAADWTEEEATQCYQ